MGNIPIPTLPYPTNALEPYMSTETVEYHYGKHHLGYVKKLNTLYQENETDLVKLIREFKGKKNQSLFDLAGQTWNHTFFWNGLKPNKNQEVPQPTGAIESAIKDNYGDFKKFQEEFTNKATTLFGSGWVWLVKDTSNNKLSIIGTTNAETPISDPKLIPLLTIDVWEHAYYIDTRNDRAKYVEKWWKLEGR